MHNQTIEKIIKILDGRPEKAKQNFPFNLLKNYNPQNQGKDSPTVYAVITEFSKELLIIELAKQFLILGNAIPGEESLDILEQLLDMGEDKEGRFNVFYFQYL